MLKKIFQKMHVVKRAVRNYGDLRTLNGRRWLKCSFFVVS